MSKADKQLGIAVNNHLESIGKHTPYKDNGLTPSEKIEMIERHFTKIMETMGLDLSDDSLVETPKRVAKMYVNEIFTGLSNDAFPKATTVENKMDYDTMVLERNIKVMSACEHHFVTIDGLAHVAYIPKNKVLGLSKINRIVDYFARRPQIQERLTSQIGEALKFILETDDVAVTIDAVHYCVKSRGIQDQTSTTTTSFVSGAFKVNPETRAEYLSNIRQ
jgi:GTP cyclohydrolase I